MALIQNPGPTRKLQRALRLTELPDAVLAPELVGVILVEDLSAPLTDIERGCHGAVNRAAVAAENSIIVLVRVGAPAEYDLKVTEIFFTTDTTQLIFIRVPTVAVVGLSVAPNTTFTDQNLPGRPTSQLASDTQVAIPAGRNIWIGRVLANTPVRIKTDIRIGTIGRGEDLTSIMIAANAQNNELTGGFVWTEAQPEG